MLVNIEDSIKAIENESCLQFIKIDEHIKEALPDSPFMYFKNSKT